MLGGRVGGEGKGVAKEDELLLLGLSDVGGEGTDDIGEGRADGDLDLFTRRQWRRQLDPVVLELTVVCFVLLGKITERRTRKRRRRRMTTRRRRMTKRRTRSQRTTKRRREK